MTPEIDALHAAHASLIAEVRALRVEVDNLRQGMATGVPGDAGKQPRRKWTAGKTLTGSRPRRRKA